uniref:Exoskeleton protein RP43 n=1 Tax=Magallana gigas TaxID=29159 RepID=K1RX14_MAGGI
MQEYVSSTCDVTAQEIQADSSLRFLTSTGYTEGSGSYINNMDCWWRIDSGGDDLKLLLFLTRDLACPGDKISIYDGDSSTATPLVSDLCGTSATPTHYSTTQRHAYIRLVTDASVSRAGIKLEFLAAKDYCSAKTCRWLITSLVGNVDLDIVFSDIEDDLPSRCDYDKYTINDGNDRCENNVIRTVCSQYPKVAPFTFTSSGSSVVVFFVSDSSVNRRGFLLKYKSNATYTTTTVTQTTESISPLATSSSVEKSNKVSCVPTPERYKVSFNQTLGCLRKFPTSREALLLVGD